MGAEKHNGRQAKGQTESKAQSRIIKLRKVGLDELRGASVAEGRGRKERQGLQVSPKFSLDQIRQPAASQPASQSHRNLLLCFGCTEAVQRIGLSRCEHSLQLSLGWRQ